VTTRYVGSGGNDGNNGLTWATRKLTLNGVEDTPVVAGDTVYVGPGTYREMLTVDVSGAAGQLITYNGDYTGANTDGVGGVVRITGSDNDQTETRASCITGTSKNYRTFRGFYLDTVTTQCVYASAGTNWILDQLMCIPGAGYGMYIPNAATSFAISNCYVNGYSGCIYFIGAAAVDNTGNVVSNCVLTGAANTNSFGIQSNKIGGITVRNSTIIHNNINVSVNGAMTAGQTMTVNNCIIAFGQHGCNAATAGGWITEDYNNIFAVATARTNTAVGANSLAYAPLFDGRWLFELVNAGRLLSPYDLASYSQLLNVAGTSPTATDMRGTAAIGGVREWGALEYDTTLQIEGGTNRGYIIGGMVG
jgi:hypothetical protein